MTLPLTEKYRAKSFADIKGQEQAITEIDNFYKQFPKKRAIVLNGSVGTGKTSLAIALKNEYNLELFELNASDLRNKSSLEAVLKPSTLQSSLFKKGKLILMDEADGITTSDRGGLPELLKLIAETKFPIIITANDIWARKFSPLRKKCGIINLKELDETTIKEIMNNILPKEKKQVKQETINLIAKHARGDVRAALNDLQSIFDLGEDALIEEFDEREKQDTIFNALKKVFQEPTTKEILRVYDNTRMNLDEISLWVEKNIPLEYSGNALERAQDALSKADVFKGRIYRQQHWRFLVYQNFFLSAGISAATRLKYQKFQSYQKPTRILKIWMSNMKNAKKKSIITKYSQLTHMSKKKAAKESFLLPLILSNLSQKEIKKIELDEKELDYIKDKKAAIIVANSLNRFREN